MFGKAKNFVMNKMLERQLKNAPPEQREMIMEMMEKNPKLFEDIAKDMQAAMKKGKSQMAAAMEVMPKYQAEMQKLMGNKAPGQASSGARFNPNGTLHK